MMFCIQSNLQIIFFKSILSRLFTTICIPHIKRDCRLNDFQFSIVKATAHFYFYYMMSGSKGLSHTYEQAHVDLDLFTLVSLYCLKLKLSSDKINQKICCFLNTKYTAVNHDIFMLRVRWKEAGIMHVIVISCLIY